MLQLVIKGNRFEAAQAAADRGIPAAFVRELSAIQAKTTVHTPNQYLDATVAWYLEPGDLIDGFGFPVGSLLHYTMLPDREQEGED